jgi:hypothetical protein
MDSQGPARAVTIYTADSQRAKTRAAGMIAELSR